MNDQAEPKSKIEIRGFFAGLVATLLVYGFPIAIGLLIYFLVKHKKAWASGTALGMAVGILFWGVTCFIVLNNF